MASCAFLFGDYDQIDFIYIEFKADVTVVMYYFDHQGLYVFYIVFNYDGTIEILDVIYLEYVYQNSFINAIQGFVSFHLKLATWFQ